MNANEPGDRTVICMKWGTLYSANYVNVLFHACREHITGSFKFVCFTDDATGLNSSIEHHPIADIGLNRSHYASGAWPKLSVFLEHRNVLSGRCLFIDLDTVILDSLDPFFEVEGELICINERPWRHNGGDSSPNTTIFAFDAGSMPWIVDRLKSDRDRLVAKYVIEQAYLHGEVRGLKYWPQDWVISFKSHLRRPILIDRFLAPRRPQPPARLLAFHGKPRPVDLIFPKPGNWDVFPHYGSGAVDWMVDYWKRHDR
jgi:hypothetical protein